MLSFAGHSRARCNYRKAHHTQHQPQCDILQQVAQFCNSIYVSFGDDNPKCYRPQIVPKSMKWTNATRLRATPKADHLIAPPCNCCVAIEYENWIRSACEFGFGRITIASRNKTGRFHHFFSFRRFCGVSDDIQHVVSSLGIRVTCRCIITICWECIQVLLVC